MNEELWIELDSNVLRKIELGDLTDDLWIYVAGYRGAMVAKYEWRQGQSPHGFNTASGTRFNASAVTHVMPFVPPKPPRVA